MAAWRRRLGRLSPLRSIRVQMVLVFLLLTLLVLFLISSGLLVGIERFYTSYYSGELVRATSQEAVALSQTVGAAVTGANQALTQSTLPPLPLAGGGVVVVDPHSGVVLNESGVPRAYVGSPYPLPSALRDPGPGGAKAIVQVPGAGPQVWVSWPVVAGRQVVALLIGEYPLDQAYFVIDQMRLVLPFVALGALIVVGLLSYVLARTVTQPIDVLTRGARAMAAGDLDTRLPVHGPDEVGQLAIVLNHLARRLKQTLREIRAEQGRAAAVLQNMSDGIVVLDSRGALVTSNAAAGRMLGIDPRRAAGLPAQSVLPPALVELLRGAQEELSAELAEGGPDRRGGAVLGLGTQRVQVRWSPLIEDGEVQGRVVVLYDVTERERLEAMRKEFVANVSHELRTPITTIKLYVESLLAWGLEDADGARRKLQTVATEVDRMVRLITDLLELSKLDEQRVLHGRAPADMQLLAERVREQFLPRAKDKGIELVLVSSGADFVAHVDADRVVQVLGNLLTNALDFTPSGGRIELRVHGEDPSEVRVEVADTGTGIAARDLPRVFDRFYRVESSRSRQYGGSGLGLTIAREIVQAHGGRIDIESEEGRGTTVFFSLPRGWAP